MDHLDLSNLLLLCEEGDLDEEFLLLALLGDERRATFRFNIDNLNEMECNNYFRFNKDHLERLRAALAIPLTITCYNGTKVTGMEALCILLRRLAYPNRLGDLSPIFGRATEELSIIFNTVLNIVYNQHNNKFSNLEQAWINPATFAEAVANKGAPLDRIWGFIDGTVRGICRPKYHQQAVFNGHKRIHALKFQSVVCPNGLIADLYGPMEGRRHDAALLEESTLLQRTEQHQKFQNHALYGDPAYPLRPNLFVPFRGAVLTEEQQQFNRSMSHVREVVEWGFGDIVQLFAFLDFKKNMKLFLQPVGKMYIVGALLVNCHTCLYGNKTSQYFNLDPPALEEYLNGQ